MRFFSPIASASLAAAALVLPRSNGPFPVTIQQVRSTSGPACPPGTLVTISNEREAVTIGFDAATIAIGAGPLSMTCTVSLDILYPPGCVTTQLRANYLGFAEMRNGASGKLRRWYRFSNGNRLFPDDATYEDESPWDQVGGNELELEDDVPAGNRNPFSEPRTVNVIAQFFIGIDDHVGEEQSGDNTAKEDPIATLAVDHLTLALIDQKLIPSCQA